MTATTFLILGASTAEGMVTRVAGAAYTRADVTQIDELREPIGGIDGALVIYFAVPPSVAESACEAMQHVDLPEQTVLALEKPFGDDQQSARRLNATLQKLVAEDRIFRADRFLGRSTLLNLLGVRLANRVVEPLWSADHVDSVVVRYDESLALENRARCYDRAGARRRAARRVSRRIRGSGRLGDSRRAHEVRPQRLTVTSPSSRSFVTMSCTAAFCSCATA